MIVKDTFEAQFKSLVRRVGLLERRAGRGSVAGDLTDADNLDDILKAGTYYQRWNANASTALNYPLGGENAGWLEVGATRTLTWQRYSTYGQYNRVFVRSRYQDTWYPWKELTPTAHAADFSGGEGTISNNSTSRVSNWGSSRRSGNYLSMGNYSIGVQRSGWYEAVGSIRWSTGPGRRQVRVTLEGSGDAIAYAEQPAGTIGTFNGMIASSGPVFIAEGENIALYGWQDSGSSLEYSSFLGRVGTYLRVKYIGEDA